MNVVSLFSGIGGLELGLESLGFKTICYVENERYAQEVLVKNMDEGNLSRVPVWDDVRTFDGRRWRGVADLVCGGFPCQDISVAGKGAGIKEGTRSGLWFEFKRVVCEARPRYVLVENVSAITKRGLGTVLAGLSEVGYDAVWFTLQAAEVGALHRRERMFIVGIAREEEDGKGDVEDAHTEGAAHDDGGTEIFHEPGVGEDGKKADVEDSDATGQSDRTEQHRGESSQDREGVDRSGGPSPLREEDVADADDEGLRLCVGRTDRNDEKERRTWDINGTGSKTNAKLYLTAAENEEVELADTDSTGRGEQISETRTSERRERRMPSESERVGEDARGESRAEIQQGGHEGVLPDAEKPGRQLRDDRLEGSRAQPEEGIFGRDGTGGPSYWSAEPDVGRVANGVPSRVDRLRCLGNAVVPQVAREVGKVILLMEAKK